VPVPAGAEKIRGGFAVYGELFERVLGREGISPVEF